MELLEPLPKPLILHMRELWPRAMGSHILSPELLYSTTQGSLTTGTASYQAHTSCYGAAVHFVNTFPSFRLPQASTVTDETSKGTREPAVPEQKDRHAHLEVHHPVGHQGHHDGQDLHQHPEVGHVFLGGRSRLVRPLVRQQLGALRVSMGQQRKRQLSSPPLWPLCSPPPLSPDVTLRSPNFILLPQPRLSQPSSPTFTPSTPPLAPPSPLSLSPSMPASSLASPLGR